MKISDVVFLFEIGSHFFVTVRAAGCGPIVHEPINGYECGVGRVRGHSAAAGGQ